LFGAGDKGERYLTEDFSTSFMVLAGELTIGRNSKVDRKLEGVTEDMYRETVYKGQKRYFRHKAGTVGHLKRV